MLLALVNESVACLREGVVTDADLLDAAVIFGTGFAPFRGGPIAYAPRPWHHRVRAPAFGPGPRGAASASRPDPGWNLLEQGLQNRERGTGASLTLCYHQILT